MAERNSRPTDANCEGKGHNGGHTWRSAVVCAECGVDEGQLWHASELLLAFAEYLWKSGYTRGQSTLEATSGNPDPYTPEYFVQQFKRTKAWQLRSDYERGVEDEQRRQEAPASDLEAAVERVGYALEIHGDPDAENAFVTVLSALTSAQERVETAEARALLQRISAACADKGLYDDEKVMKVAGLAALTEWPSNELCEGPECHNPATVEMADGLRLCGDCLDNPTPPPHPDTAEDAVEPEIHSTQGPAFFGDQDGPR